jgi:hypothetical protein
MTARAGEIRASPRLLCMYMYEIVGSGNMKEGTGSNFAVEYTENRYHIAGEIRACPRRLSIAHEIRTCPRWNVGVPSNEESVIRDRALSLSLS